MGEGADDKGESGGLGVLGGLPAGGADLFEGEANSASPFARLAPRSTGRPKGSPNRRTVAMREIYLRKGYAHPMLWMGEVLTRSVRELSEELACSLLEALEVQRKVAADLAPYLESKMPTQVKAGDGEGLPVLVVGKVESAPRGLGRAAGAMAIDDDELADAIEQNQRLVEARARQSHGEQSHEGAKGEPDQALATREAAD